MSDAPLVSVVMPVYNCRQYVARAIDSVLAQTFGDFELLIIDDGSTDATPEILWRYAADDARVRVLTRPHGGVGAALNAGLAESRGKMIARMDADDICLPDRFTRQLDFLSNHPDHVLVGARVLLIDPDGDPLYEMEDIPEAHEQIDRMLLEARWAIVHPTVMMRREAVTRVGGYGDDLVPVEDHDLFLRLAEIGRLANLPDVLLHYRRHAMSSVRLLADRRVASLRRVMEAAWERRGLLDRSGFPIILPDIDRDDPRRDVKQRRRWGWLCLQSGNLPTARKYALVGIREDPFSSESWRLIYCVLRGR